MTAIVLSLFVTITVAAEAKIAGPADASAIRIATCLSAWSCSSSR